MAQLLIILALLYVGSQIAAFVALLYARKKSIALSIGRPRLLSYPGVSVITSLKGPTPGAIESIRSLLKQNYSGPIEFVFATLDDQEELIAPVKKLIAESSLSENFKSGHHRVKWIHPVEVQSDNPRTAKIAKAYGASVYPWVLMVCVDTRFAPEYLQKAIELTELKEERYVTSFPVIERPKNFFAKLEAVGLNVDVSQFFLLSSFSSKNACAYGGAFLYSRALIEKAGGYAPLLKLLTDDITLAKALSRVGGLCYLTDELVYVHQELLSPKSFWSRQIRWRMIGRFFLKDLFWLGPLSWNHLFLLLGAIFLHDNRLYWMLLLLTLSRIAVGAAIQALLKTPARDWRNAWILPIYDWLAIPAWFFAFFKNKVSWGPNLMSISSRGEVQGLVVRERFSDKSGINK